MPAKTSKEQSKSAKGNAVKKKRGKNVLGSGLQSHHDGAHLARTPDMAKSDAVRALIRDAVKANKLMVGLGDADVDVFVEYARKRTFEEGAVVITEGDTGNEFYVVESGAYRVKTSGGYEGDITSASFGELALLFNAPRKATITCGASGVLWAVDRPTFRQGVGGAARKRRKETAAKLCKVPLLTSLTPSQLEKLADAVLPLEFAPGAEVFKKGSTGDVFYIVTEGEFTVSDLDDGDDGDAAAAVKSLQAGAFFGERALLTGDTRSATVTCGDGAGGGRVLALSKADFDSTVGPLKTLVTMNEHREMLAEIAILANLDEVERLNAVRRFMPVSFEAGTVIIEEGAPGDAFFIISEGTVEITKSGGEFRAEMGPGEFFGEHALLDENDKRSATATAKTAVRAYSLSRAAFAAVIVHGEARDVITATAAQRQAKLKQAHDEVGTKIAFGDLETLAVLGAGTFGRVSLVQDKNAKGNTAGGGGSGVYALKALHKSEIVASKQEANVMNEKNIMLMCHHPFILRLFNTYKDANKLYMLLEFCPGGEMFTVIHTPERDGLPLASAKFYCAGVAAALSYLADHHIMYRDLKPENMLVDAQGYPKVIDFGFAKVSATKTYTLCGTPEYMAPEIILGRGYDHGVDWWALGVLLFEAVAGYSPFADGGETNQEVICAKIVQGRVKFPAKGFDEPTKDLCRALLNLNPAQRAGMGHRGGHEVTNGAYFKGFDWGAYTAKAMPAPWLPPISSPTDASHFDPYDVDNSVDPNYKDVGDWDRDF